MTKNKHGLGRSLDTISSEIIQRVSNFKDINFDKSGEGSLFHQLAVKFKIGDKKTWQHKLRNQWNAKNSQLKSLVSNAFEVKKNLTLVPETNQLNADDKPVIKEKDRIDKHFSYADAVYQRPKIKVPSGLVVQAAKSAVASSAVFPEVPQHENNSARSDVISSDEFDVIDCGAGGNCLFHCCSYHCENDPSNHMKYRREVVDYVDNNWESEFEALSMTKEITDVDYEDFLKGRGWYRQVYNKRMGKFGTYGTDYELSIFVRLHSVGVSIYRAQEKSRNVVKWLGPDRITSASHLNLLFSGDRRDGHWQILRFRPDFKTKSPDSVAFDTFSEVALNRDVESACNSMSEVPNSSDIILDGKPHWRQISAVDTPSPEISSETIPSEMKDQQDSNSLSVESNVIETIDEITIPITANKNLIQSPQLTVDTTLEVSQADISSIQKKDELITPGKIASTVVEAKKFITLKHVRSNRKISLRAGAGIDSATPDPIFSQSYVDPVSSTFECISSAASPEPQDVSSSTNLIGSGVSRASARMADKKETAVSDHGLNGNRNDAKNFPKISRSSACSMGNPEVYSGFSFNDDKCVYDYESNDEEGTIKGPVEQNDANDHAHSEKKTARLDDSDDELTEESDSTVSDEDSDQLTSTNVKMRKQTKKIRAKLISCEKKIKDLQKRRKIAIKCNKELGQVEFPVTSLQDADGHFSTEEIHDTTRDLMLKALRITCVFGFYGKCRINKGNSITFYATCVSGGHEQHFRFHVKYTNEPVVLLLALSDQASKYVHENPERTTAHIRVKKRKEWGEKLEGIGAKEFLNKVAEETHEELAQDGNYQDYVSYNVVAKIRSENNCKNRLPLESYDMGDLIALQMSEEGSKDQFVRMAASPLEEHMWSEGATSALSDEEVVIWHGDATSARCRCPKGMGSVRILNHSIVARHPTTNLLLASAITCKHDITTIKRFFDNFKSYLVKEMFSRGRLPLENVYAAVFDWSWPHWHAFLEVFNGVDIDEYLHILYDYCNLGLMPTKKMILLKNCYGHYMKMSSRSLDKNFPQYKSPEGKPCKRFVMEMLSMLCVSRNLKELDLNFNFLCKILLAKSESSVNESINHMKNEIKKNEKKFGDTLSKTEELPKPNEYETILIVEEKSQAIYKRSEFYKRYLKILVKVKFDIEQMEKKVTEIDNKYYAPDVADHILVSWMAYAPIWTAIDLDLVSSKIGRLSNAYIESSFRGLDVVYFKYNPKASVADRVRQMKKSVTDSLARIRIGLPNADQKKNHRIELYPKPDTDSMIDEADNPFVEEAFVRKMINGKKGDKSTKVKEKTKLKSVLEVEKSIGKKKTEKSTKEEISEEKVVVGTRKRKYVAKIISNGNKKMKQDDSEHTPSQESDEPIVIPSLNGKPDGDETSGDDTEIRVLDTLEISDGPDSDEEALADTNNRMKQMEISGSFSTERSVERIEKIPKHYNGLTADPQFYNNDKPTSNVMVVGMYSSTLTISVPNTFMTCHEFSLIPPPAWFNDWLIDAYLASNIDSWDDVCHVSTDDTKYILGDKRESRFVKDRRVCQYQGQLKSRIMLPYSNGLHWRLFTIDTKKEEYMLLDPYWEDGGDSKALDYWKNFCRKCPPASPFNKLKDIDWKEAHMRERPFQKDGHNCGPFTLCYAERWGTGDGFRNDPKEFNPKTEKMEVVFDIDAYRYEIARKLLIRSKMMGDRCPYCGSHVNNDDSSIECEDCNRKFHKKCIIRIDRANKTYEKSNIYCNKFNCYICVLCESYRDNIPNEICNEIEK
ncbi:hypothetical protein QAD02_021200 [Eretmocerus hayati]|uniref:Uncharacterized protein n=1 Tax=Eretmocerus hayati TaxID=131215 RepID=A0ACC2PSQ8_9HYME|nr:hypothetical protein QAD02_021200 [Eretmocerus hayati]